MCVVILKTTHALTLFCPGSFVRRAFFFLSSLERPLRPFDEPPSLFCSIRRPPHPERMHVQVEEKDVAEEKDVQAEMSSPSDSRRTYMHDPAAPPLSVLAVHDSTVEASSITPLAKSSSRKFYFAVAVIVVGAVGAIVAGIFVSLRTADVGNALSLQSPPPPPPSPLPPGAVLVILHVVSSQFTLQGTVEDFPASRTQAIAGAIATAGGVSASDVTVTVAPASVRISVDIVMSNSSAAQATAATLGAPGGAFANTASLQTALAAGGVAGVVVESIDASPEAIVTTVQGPSPPLPFLPLPSPPPPSPSPPPPSLSPPPPPSPSLPPSPSPPPPSPSPPPPTSKLGGRRMAEANMKEAQIQESPPPEPLPVSRVAEQRPALPS